MRIKEGLNRKTQLLNPKTLIHILFTWKKRK